MWISLAVCGVMQRKGTSRKGTLIFLSSFSLLFAWFLFPFLVIPLSFTYSGCSIFTSAKTSWHRITMRYEVILQRLELSSWPAWQLTCKGRHDGRWGARHLKAAPGAQANSTAAEDDLPGAYSWRWERSSGLLDQRSSRRNRWASCQGSQVAGPVITPDVAFANLNEINCAYLDMYTQTHTRTIHVYIYIHI